MAAQAQERGSERQAINGLSQHHSPWRLLRANLHDLRSLLRDSFAGLAGLALLLLLDTIYLMRISSPDTTGTFTVLAALYESLRLLIFQSGLALPHDALGVLLFFLTPLLGLGLLVQSVSRFARRLLDKSSRRQTWQVALASTFHEHVIVCGLGRVGLRVATQLIAAGYGVVFVEHEWGRELVTQALEMNVPVVVGDAREQVTLRQAGVMHARAVIACINGDLLNIEIALATRRLRPKLPVVLRAFDEELDAGVESVFGKDSTFSTSALAAPTLAAAMLSRGIDYVLPPIGGHADAREQLGVSRLTIPTRSTQPRAIGSFEEQRGVRVLALTTKNGSAVPWSMTGELKAGAAVDMLGTLPAIEELRREHEAALADADTRAALAESTGAALSSDPSLDAPLIVCGLGKVGYRVVRLLTAREPHPRIVVIQLKDDPDSFVHRIDDPDVRIVFGDARNPEVLRQAGVERAFALAALTSNDLTNLQIGLAARRACADVHLVLRVFSDALADKLVEMFGIHTTYSTSGLAAPTLSAAAILPGTSYAFAAGSVLYSGEEVVARPGDSLSGRSVAQIRQRAGKLVIVLRRNGQSWVLPPADEIVHPGDQLTILAALHALSRRR